MKIAIFQIYGFYDFLLLKNIKSNQKLSKF